MTLKNDTTPLFHSQHNTFPVHYWEYRPYAQVEKQFILQL